MVRSDDDSPQTNVRAASIVPFLFGVAERDRLPGTVLVRLLTDSGVSESAARSVLARLRTEGALRSVRHGRRTDYELAGLVAGGFRRARDTGHPEEFGPGPGAEPWPGEFYGLLFSLPDDERAYRDRLRTAARLAGYAPLRPGLMISPWDGRPALADTVAGLPGSASVQTLILRFAPEAARSAAAEAWRLPSVAANIRALAASLDRAVRAETESRAGSAALARYGELAVPAYRFFVGVPQLPVELLPADWPMSALVDALARVREVVGGPAEAYVAAVLAAAH